MFGDEEAFLQASRDDPPGDAPRQIVADYLDEHGDSLRAEFIRIDCELARQGPWWTLDRRRWATLFRRDRELRQAIEARLLRDTHRQPGMVYELRRGFPGILLTTLDALLQHGEAALESAPLEELRWSEGIQRLLDSPHLQRLRILDLSSYHVERISTAVRHALLDRFGKFVHW